MKTSELREDLYKQMKGVMDGSVTVKEGHATAKIAAQIIYAKRVDIEEANLNYKVSKSIAKNAKVKPTQL